MIGIHYDNALRFSSAGTVDGASVVLSFLNHPLRGSGIRGYDRNGTIGINNIIESYVNEFHAVLRLFYVLNLLAYLFKLALHLDDNVGNFNVARF